MLYRGRGNRASWQPLMFEIRKAMSQQRKPLLTLTEAIKLYGAERVRFPRPRFVDEGFCEWCGKPILNRRRKSCCCEECSDKFNIATSPVYYANHGSAGGYRGHIFRRDKFTCQICGEFHVKYSEFNIPLPTTDGQLDLHHIKPVTEGGTDAPDNLLTVCRDCHKSITAEWRDTKTGK